MASILNSQGFLATAMAAVSGTVILLALRLQKSPPPSPPRSCIILSDGKRVSSSSSTEKQKKAAKTKKIKKVHFAEDVVDPTGYSDEFKRQHGIIVLRSSSANSRSSSSSSSNNNKQEKSSSKARSMPANRMALYNGILRDRVGHRLAYSY